MRLGDADCGLRLPTTAAVDGREWGEFDRLGGAMELRVSVRSLVHQLVHEQAKANVHLEGLQRHVSTLLDFRESLMSRSLTSTRPRPVVTLPSGPGTHTAAPSTPTELTSAGTSGLGASTSTTGASATSTSGTASTSVTATASELCGGGGGGGAESGASADTYLPVSAATYAPAAADGDGDGDGDGDELMSLLEAIEAQGRQLVRQTRRGEADSAPPSPQCAEGGRRTEAAAGGARSRCGNCDRTEGHSREAGSNPSGGGGFGARRRTVEPRRPSGVRLLEGAGAELLDWEPAWDRSPLFTDPPPLSLPDLRPGQERLTALSLSERLLQERDALLGQLTGLEQVAVRSQLHAAGLQTRLHRVLAVNDALDRELRLAGGQRLPPGAPAPAPAAPAPAPAPAEDRMARSTPDLRLPSRIPQPVSLRRTGAGRGGSPHAAGQERSPAGQERSLHRPRSPYVRQDRSLQPAGQDRPPQARSRSRETQTNEGATADDTPRVVDRGVGAVESTTRVVDSTTSIDVCTTSVGTSTSLLDPANTTDETRAVESPSSRRRPGMHHATAQRAIRPPDKSRVSAILRETSPLKLQKELLSLLVEAEALRALVDSLGRRWASQASEGGEVEQPTASQTDGDDIRLQLEMRNIELEGTRARLRQLEAAWATRSALDGAAKLPSTGAAAADTATSTSASTSASASTSTSASASRRSPSPRPSSEAALAARRNLSRSGSRLGSAAGSGSASDAARRSGRQPGAAPRAGDVGESVDLSRRAVSPSRRLSGQSDSSLRLERVSPVVSIRSEPQRQAGSGSFPRPGVSPTPRQESRRPATPTRPASRSGMTGSRPGSRGDTTSGRPHGRSKTPTRPHSRTGLSATPGSSPRSCGSAGSPANLANNAAGTLSKPANNAAGVEAKATSSAASGLAKCSTGSSGPAPKPAGGSGSSGGGSGSSGGGSGSSGGGSGSSGGGIGSAGQPVVAAGRCVADLVRGWTEAVEPQRHAEKPPAAATELPEQRDKARRRLSSESSAKIPATQSQALGQILTALSRGHSPRAPLRRTAADPAPDLRPDGAGIRIRHPDDGAGIRTAAEVRWLREATAQRLRQARLETSDGEVADSLTSATASEDGGDGSLEDRLKLIEDGGGGRGGGGGFRYGDGLVLSAGEGLIQRILSGRGGKERVKPRPAAD